MRGLPDCGKWFFNKRYVLFEKDLASVDDLRKTPFLESIELKMIRSPEELERLIKSVPNAGSFPIFADLKDGLKKGGIVFLVLSGGECAHMSLVILERRLAEETDHLYRIFGKANSGYIGPCYTSPGYRGRGIYPFVLTEINKFLKGEGRLAALINTKTTNLSSAAGILKAGFKKIAEVKVIRVFSFEFQKKIEVKDGG